MTDAKITSLKNGKKLFVDIYDGPHAESTDAPTIVFLHGLGSNTSFYQAPFLASSLPTSHRLVRYDFDGHGLSPVSGETVSIDSLVEDLKSVIETVGAKGKVGVVAHSMSGLVALTFASKYPELLDKLLLIGPVKSMPEAGVKVMQGRAATVRSSGLSAIASQIANTATSSYTKKNSPLSLAIIRALVLPTPAEGYARACEALAGAKDPDWTKIEVKTLVVGGEEDYMCSPELVKFLTDNVKNASSVEMKDVGHWHAVEQPVELAKVIDEWFTSA
ncbi:alpha/beta-hydrolase [Meredithblackwellia eburnea MCA 4105]